MKMKSQPTVHEGGVPTTKDDLDALVKTLYIHARRLGASQETAEDMVQEALAIPLARTDWFDPERGALPTALRAVITHRFIDLCRSRERRRRLSVYHAPPEALGSPGAHMADRTAWMNRQRFMAQLDEDEREVFGLWLRQSQGDVRGPEAAEVLGLTYREYEAAKKRLRRRSAHILEELGLTTADLWGGVR